MAKVVCLAEGMNKLLRQVFDQMEFGLMMDISRALEDPVHAQAIKHHVISELVGKGKPQS